MPADGVAWSNATTLCEFEMNDHHDERAQVLPAARRIEKHVQTIATDDHRVAAALLEVGLKVAARAVNGRSLRRRRSLSAQTIPMRPTIRSSPIGSRWKPWIKYLLY